MLNKLKRDLKKFARPEKIAIYSNFFKTGKGQYGEGDKFLAITVPDQRKIAIKYQNISLEQVKKLAQAKYHEERLTALLILVQKYQNGDEKTKKKIVNFYLKNTDYINNWDLVDATAPKIIGNYLLDKNRAILYTLSRSNHLWKKRIAIVATYEFIRNNQFKDTIKIAEILLNDKHDLIHKAVGWMLREVGKRDKVILKKFLKKYCKTMPRTMLRYSIEKFSKTERKFYMTK